MVTPRILSEFSREMPGSGGGGVAAALHHVGLSMRIQNKDTQ